MKGGELGLALAVGLLIGFLGGCNLNAAYDRYCERSGECDESPCKGLGEACTFGGQQGDCCGSLRCGQEGPDGGLAPICAAPPGSECAVASECSSQACERNQCCLQLESTECNPDGGAPCCDGLQCEQSRCCVPPGSPMAGQESSCCTAKAEGTVCCIPPGQRAPPNSPNCCDDGIVDSSNLRCCKPPRTACATSADCCLLPGGLPMGCQVADGGTETVCCIPSGQQHKTLVSQCCSGVASTVDSRDCG